MKEQEKRWISSEDLFAAVQEVLQDGMSASFVVTGMSMWPIMCHGRDQVVVEPIDTNSLRVGDIVLFQPVPGKYILHRITKLQDDKFETTGDGNLFRDGWFPKESVVARTVSIIRPNWIISCDSRLWHMYSHIWMRLYPIRRPIFAVWEVVRPWLRLR